MTDYERAGDEIEAREQIQDVQTENRQKPPDVANAVEILRKGMYPERVRFFLELVQNAVDAARETKGGCEVDITITDENVIFKNDARLFSKQDVENLCSIGQTYKRDNPEYIGYWGFGFKSVFKVTNRAYVISPPYRFKFDREAWDDSEAPWEITPVWVDSEELDGLPVDSENDYNTFVFPYKGDSTFQSEIRDDILARVHDILDSELPLFLSNLREIMIKDHVSGQDPRTLAATKVGDRSGGEIQRTAQGSKWWVYREIHDVPDSISSHPETEEWHRDGVEKREVVICVGIDDEGRLEPRGSGPHAGIYSFTPLGEEQVDLPFLVQGDFLAEAQRRTAEKDIRWNQWLAEKAGETVVRAAKELFDEEEWKHDVYEALIPQQRITHRMFGGHDTRDAWPGLDEVGEDRTEFAGTDAVIVEWFKTAPTMLTLEGTRVPPGDVRIPSSEEIAELIPDSDLKELEDASYANREIWNLDSWFQLRLDIGEIDPDRVIGLLREHPEYLKTKAEENDTEWFQKLYEVLQLHIAGYSSRSTKRKREQRLQDVSFILTEEGLVSPGVDERLVVIGQDDETDNLLRDIGESTDKRALMEPFDVLLVKQGAAASETSRQFLQRFDVEEVDQKWITEHIVVPRLSNPDVTAEEVLSLTPYVEESVNPRRVEGMMVATSDGNVAPADEVYFGEGYEQPFDVEAVFGEEADYLSPAYRERYDWDDEWREFFEDLGVNTGEEDRSQLEALAGLPERELADEQQIEEILSRIYEFLAENIAPPDAAVTDEVTGNGSIPLFGTDGDFHPATDLYLPNSELQEVFSDASEEAFVWTPEFLDDGNLRRHFEKFGVQDGEEEYDERVFTEGRSEEDDVVSERIKKTWSEIRKEVSAEQSRPRVRRVEEAGTVFTLGEAEIKDLSEDGCVYDEARNTIFVTSEFNRDWEALAGVLSDALGGTKGVIARSLQKPSEISLEELAIDLIIQHESSDFDITDVRDDDRERGCDLVAEAENETRYIEVKAQSEKRAVELIGKEPDRAEQDRDEYWVYVVVFGEEGTRGWRLRNPASRDYDEVTAWRINSSVWEDTGEQFFLDTS